MRTGPALVYASWLDEYTPEGALWAAQQWAVEASERAAITPQGLRLATDAVVLEVARELDPECIYGRAWECIEEVRGVQAALVATASSLGWRPASLRDGMPNGAAGAAAPAEDGHPERSDARCRSRSHL